MNLGSQLRSGAGSLRRGLALTVRLGAKGARLWGRPAAHPIAATAPFAAMAVVVAVDVSTGPTFGLLPLLSLGPAFAAVLMNPVRIVLVGLLAMVVCLPVAALDGLLGSGRAVIAIVTIAGVTGAGAVASIGRQRRERDLADVRAVADAVQQVLLRPVRSHAGGTDVAVRYLSASTSAQVGGDLYEFILSGDTVRLIVADVKGHGLTAVGTAAVILGAFRAYGYDAASLTEIATKIELSLLRHLAGDDRVEQPAEEFVTAVLAEVGPGTPARVEILNCGHPPPLLLASEGGAKYLDPEQASPPLGLAQMSPSPRATTSLQLSAGDRILFYTDGISEARNRHGEYYSPAARRDLLLDPDLSGALDHLCQDVVQHVGHRLSDDATALLMSIAPAGGPDARPHGLVVPRPDGENGHPRGRARPGSG